ncbi:uncharacterized protein LOC120073696 [Benincasa hispida]|uniref:uncharacterized protein LOC120073696 n=1 Tax=Benincasa hispida TaxID=102211 RepID=UPI001902AA29|nr:uncharacterized protein LOC120073696 [Benincasa hispida]
MKGMLRFDMKGKLNHWFIGSFEILERIRPVVYLLALPSSLSKVRNVFHVSMLRMYIADSSHIVDYEPLQSNENISYKEKPIQILTKEMNALRHKEICFDEDSLVKSSVRKSNMGMRRRDEVTIS